VYGKKKNSNPCNRKVTTIYWVNQGGIEEGNLDQPKNPCTSLNPVEKQLLTASVTANNDLQHLFLDRDRKQCKAGLSVKEKIG